MSVNIEKVSPTVSITIGEATLSVTPPPTPTATPTPTSSCQPVISTGISILDNVIFCVGGYGITVLIVGVVFVLLMLLIRRK